MIGITLTSNDSQYRDLAFEASERFTRYTGCVCNILQTPTAGNYSAKLQLWKMFTNTNQSFCFFDCDNWLMRDCDLKQFDNHKDFIGVTDSLGQIQSPSNWPDSFTHIDAVRHGIPFDQMINGGFWIANAKHHQHIFEKALSDLRDPNVEFDDFGEQSSLSKAIYESEGVLKQLPVEYNCMVGGSTERKDICDNPYFVHAAGMKIELKMEYLLNQEIELNANKS